jgi:hypothetical protein
MTHFIMSGGPFEIAAIKLQAMLPTLTWFDVTAAQELPKGLTNTDLLSEPQPLSGRRTVYRCPTCWLRAESRSNASLICGTCELAMRPVGLR